MAGDSVTMAPNSMMMIHEASGLCMGNAVDMRELADLLDKTSANIADIYSRRSGRPADEHRSAMRSETWYSDQEAVDAGLADTVLGSESQAENKATVAVIKAETGPETVSWDDLDIDLEAIRSALKGA
jgi:ATP-dependent protease ClpP protease subunit